MATPENALLDLIYLHPEYKSEEDFVNLRLDEDFMAEEFDWKTAEDMCTRWSITTMHRRLELIKKIYR